MTKARARGAAFLALLLVALLFGASVPPHELHAQSLRGSGASLDRQNRQAQAHDFTKLRDRAHVQRFIGAGLLVPVRGNGDFEVHRVSFPYARPEVRTFIHRLGTQYHRACGRKLVVTSLTRPWTHQPRNGSDRSVHPTGMAVDLRRSNSQACRAWLESTLLYLEGAGVLEATRERWPPHYHVALFPQPYTRYVDRLQTRLASNEADGATGAREERRYTVRSGDSLWEIARRHGVSVTELRMANRIRGSAIYPGQNLRIPAAGAVTSASILTYQVQRGDSLWEIARAHRTTVAELRASNGLGGSRIYEGQVLTVPVGR